MIITSITNKINNNLNKFKRIHLIIFIVFSTLKLLSLEVEIFANELSLPVNFFFSSNLEFHALNFSKKKKIVL